MPTTTPTPAPVPPEGDPAILAAFLIIGALLFLVYAAWSSRYYPYAPCRTCEGKGRFMEPGLFRKSWKPCPACGGGSKRIRTWTKIFWQSRIRSGQIK